MFSPVLPRHAARTTRSRSLAMAAALALTLTGLGLAQPALAAGETVSVTPTAPAAGQSPTREIVLTASIEIPAGATGGTAVWSVQVGGNTVLVPSQTFTVEPRATSIALTPATISSLPRGGVWLDWTLTVTLTDGTIVSDTGSQARGSASGRAAGTGRPSCGDPTRRSPGHATGRHSADPGHPAGRPLRRRIGDTISSARGG